VKFFFFIASSSKVLDEIENLRLEVSKISSEKETKDDMEKRFKKLNTELKKKEQSIDKMQGQKTELRLRLKLISDNLNIRDIEQKLDEKRKKIEVQPNSPSFLEKHILLQKEELRNLMKERETALRQQGEASGMLNQKESRLQEILSELEKPELKNADEEYRKCFIEKETLSIAQQDLDKFTKTLDEALIKFHQTKMECINRRITELWQATYQNSDIDTIQIHSDIERRTSSGAKTSSSRGTRYSVVMVKDGVEMDMRGRCSSGQKMLACIIIRIALAEIFCLDCSILALDEPTTNLDKRNAIGLAKALNRLIEAQQRNRSFQLIIITHDQDFADEFHCERFYRVEKTGPNLFSTIKLKDCSRI